MKSLLHIPIPKIPPEKKARTVRFLNRYSLLFHILLSMLLCFAIEVISRHSIEKAFGFVALHTWAFAYNYLIIFS